MLKTASGETGLLKCRLDPVVRQILFEEDVDRWEELDAISRVDCAHLLMLAERGILPAARVRAALEAIDNLARCGFEPLRTRTADRGTFLLYEQYLRETHGDQIGGMLQTARSRNDLGATVLKLRIRKPYLAFLESALRLQHVVLRKARQHATIVMPAYTHYQAAVPITYGHYLAGLATALDRDIGHIMQAASGLHVSPLGAGAVGGTEWPIDTATTARLLGFRRGPLNSVDAVASRDLPLRLLAGLAIYGTTISRLASDLLLWMTAEFGFLRLPDQLTGSSSAMPQKRNPFVLEHVRGRTAAITGALVTALGSMHAAPFTNSIEVGTEALRPFWSALTSAIELTTLTRLVVAEARPDRDAMRRRAEEGNTVATSLANRLVRETGLDFRSSHRLIGSIVRTALERGTSLMAVAEPSLRPYGIDLGQDGCDSAVVCGASAYGGGAALSSLQRCLAHVRRSRQQKSRLKRAHARQWEHAGRMLTARVRRALASGRTTQEKSHERARQEAFRKHP